MIKAGTAVVLLTLVAGCAVQRQARFDPEECASYERPGTATVSGQAFLKTRGGDVKYGAGNTVELRPVTTYSVEWYRTVVVSGRGLAPGDSRENAFVRSATADGEGRFRLEGLPGDKYYVTCNIIWETATGYEGSLRPTGGIARG